MTPGALGAEAVPILGSGNGGADDDGGGVGSGWWGRSGGNPTTQPSRPSRRSCGSPHPPGYPCTGSASRPGSQWRRPRPSGSRIGSTVPASSLACSWSTGVSWVGRGVDVQRQTPGVVGPRSVRVVGNVPTGVTPTSVGRIARISKPVAPVRGFLHQHRDQVHQLRTPPGNRVPDTTNPETICGEAGRTPAPVVGVAHARNPSPSSSSSSCTGGWSPSSGSPIG